MLSTLKFEKITMPVADLGAESSLPSIAKLSGAGEKFKSLLDETDGLYVGWGMQDDIFPYRLQDLYNRDKQEKEVDVAILENEHLKATFCPSLGGKLLSLFDKDANKELLFSNKVIQPCNLALRNAWTSGGVEWNIGMVGHTPFTCSQIFTAKLQDTDGTPILRMYEFERIRRVTYQMDFYLPQKSKLLYCRMRIVNPNETVVPMYWWSNMAVPEGTNSRVITSANSAYTSEIIDGTRVVYKVPIPHCDGFDATYPKNTADRSRDYFYRTNDDKPRYVTCVDEEGYGLIQTSTSLLKGRKLFVWGQGPGAQHWQDYLSLDNEGNYVEIQAGLCRSQYEHMPMPPKTAWEWIEVYGAVKCNPKKAHSDFATAQAEVEKQLKKAVSIDKLETELKSSKERFALSANAEIVYNGSAWGELENVLRNKNGGKPISEHLDFGTLTDEQSAWNSLINEQTVGEHNVNDIPPSWMMQDEYIEMLEASVENKDKDNWYTWLQLGTVYIVKGEFLSAEKALKNSLKCADNCWANYCLAILALKAENKSAAKKYANAALKLKSDDVSLCKAILSILNKANEYKSVIKFYESFNDDIKSNSRARLEYITALANDKKYEAAMEILNENGGFVLADVKEEEICLSDLYALCYTEIAKKNGETVHEVEIPRAIDFRLKPENIIINEQ